MDNLEKILKKELIWLLTQGGAHASFDEAVARVPKKYYGVAIVGQPYTLWMILNHMRITQHDILDYITNPNYVEPNWPDGYWPDESAPSSATAWKDCIKEIHQDLKTLIQLIERPKTKIMQAIPHIKGGPTIFHEMLLLADHNSYHIGQLILLRGYLGIWRDE